MNERQAESQYKLSNKRNPGRSSVFKKNEEDDFEDEDSMYLNSEDEPEKRVSVKAFLLSIIFGLVLDVVSFFLPILGWSVGTVLIILLYFKLGVKFHFKNLMKFGGCSFIESIPVINMFPAFTLAIILNVGPMVWGGEQEGEEPSQSAHKVQRAISMIKK
jgi:hypothetical protein